MRGYATIVFLLVSHSVLSQVQELNALVKTWQGSMTQVVTGSRTIDQEILSPEPATIRYNYTETDQKGVKIVYGYEFNLADIDPYTVRTETQKDILWVVLSVRNKQKLAKTFKNEAVQAYDETIKIHSKNIDNAREMVDVIKKAIPLAEKIVTTRLKLTDYNEMVSWLLAHVQDVDLGTKKVSQQMTKGVFVGSLKMTVIESDAKTSHEENFEFNLADMNVNSIAFKVRGNQFGLSIEMMQGLKCVYYKRDGEVKSFVDEVIIETRNVDEARDLKNLLTLVVPLAVTKVASDMPAVSSEKDGLKFIASVLREVKYGDHQITQTMEPGCLTALAQVNQGSSSAEKNSFAFNWMDLNPNDYKIEVAGEKMFIDVITLEKKKIIQHSKNDKHDGYESEARFYTVNMEDARRMKFAMDKVIDQCKKSYREPFQPDVKSMVSYLQKSIGEVTLEGISIKQVFEPVADNNKIKLTKITVKTSNSTEEVFEFNLSDINPASLAYELQGKELQVSFETNFKAKIINYYKGGKIQPYAYKVDISMPDAETARNVMSAIRKSAEKQKK